MGHVERHKRGTWLQALWVFGDTLGIALGYLVGYWIRFHPPLADWIPPTKGIPPLSIYLQAAAVTILVWVPLFHAMSLYRLERGKTRLRRRDLMRGLVVGVLIVAGVAFFYRGASFSRLAMSLIWFFSSLLIFFGRRLSQVFLSRWSRLRPIRFAVVGQNPAATHLVTSLTESSFPHEFIGYFVSDEGIPGTAGSRSTAGRGLSERSQTAELEAVESLGAVDSIRDRAAELDLDLVIMAAGSGSEELLENVYAQCQELDLDFQFVPDLLSLWGRRVKVEEIQGLPVLRLRDLPLVGWNGVIKRALDLTVSAAILLVLSPLLIGIALAVKLDSPGPVWIRQERVGRDRRPFPMLKYRSMRIDAEQESGPVWAQENDPRRTRTGIFLRRWSLDELPQLFNVFLGQMSLVGPRPERPFFVHQFEQRVQDYYDRHRVKSGMTGWAQVHGLRGNVPIEHRTSYDLFYVENWSLLLDLRILWMTARAVVTHGGE